jgi:transposase
VARARAVSRRPEHPLDNNATERALRGPVVGRKNHYGSRSRRGTEVAALFYTLLESAKLAGVDPRAYLRAAVHAALAGQPVPLPHTMAAAPTTTASA